MVIEMKKLWSALANCFVLWPVEKNGKPKRGSISEARDLRGDWERVGDDLKKAISDWGHEHHLKNES